MRIDFAITPHTSNAEVLGQLDILEGRVFGLEPGARALAAVTLHRELSGQQRQHDRAVDRRAGAIDHGNVARKQSGAGHAFARDPHREGRGRVLDQQLVEIERTVQIVVGRRRKPAGRRRGHQGHRGGPPGRDVEKGIDVSCPQRLVGQALRQGRHGQRQTHHPGRLPRRAPHPLRQLCHVTPTFCYRKSRRVWGRRQGKPFSDVTNGFYRPLRRRQSYRRLKGIV